MKVGIAALSDASATVERCRQLGVDTVYLTCARFPGFVENGYPESGPFKAFKEELEANGIQVPGATTWFAKWPPRPWVREGATNPDVLLSRAPRCIDAMKRMLEVFGQAGITSVLHYVDLGKPEDAAQEEACWEGIIEIYRELVPIAEEYGIGIGNHSLHRLLADGVREKAISSGVRIEDYGAYRAAGWGGPFLVDTWRALERLVDAVPSPCNGVTLCTGMDIPGGDVPALVRQFSGKIHFCQFRDHTARWPAGREVPPGEGIVDLEAVVGALKAVDYRGIVHPEHLGKPRIEGEDLLAKSTAYIKTLLKGA